MQHAARTLEEVLGEAGDRKVFLALSGGSTPVLLYRLLASREKRIPWERLEVFFGDERGVPPDHPDSNYRVARDIARRHSQGDASTEDLRQAMVLYRELFEDLLETRSPADVPLERVVNTRVERDDLEIVRTQRRKDLDREVRP